MKKNNIIRIFLSLFLLGSLSYAAGESFAETLQGRIIHKDWTKTPESWMAGGSDYYVLDIGNAEVKEKSAREGVILKSSDKISEADFERMAGRHVEVKGEYVQAKEVSVEDPMLQRPVMPDIGGKAIAPASGAGFKVYEMRSLE